MDQKNPFESPNTFRLHRAEYVVAQIVVTVLIILHLKEIRWIPAIGLFLYIDLIGYIPGAIAFRRSPNGRIPKAYYVLYNTMHSMLTQGAVIALWGFFVGWEWALLLIPWHLFGDRGVFGNFMKSFDLPFEPHEAPGYRRLIEGIRSADRPVVGAHAAAGAQE
ncbi:MAG TPA: hypothetical protein VJX66_27380 [Amycolatopsis sp.]|nr:hypothetical protein [Amycolatopsis sp.]